MVSDGCYFGMTSPCPACLTHERCVSKEIYVFADGSSYGIETINYSVNI